MRFLTILLFVHLSFQSISQITVKNTTPGVSLERRLVVYIGMDNPITISTGNAPTAKVTVKNGLLFSAGGNGKYWLRVLPDKYSPTVTLTVTTPTQEQEFVFDVLAIPNPEIQFAGTRNDDNEFDNFRYEAKGVFCYFKYFEIPAVFRVDSFIVTIHHLKDSASLFLHINKGAAWDSVTLKEIWATRAESFMTIKKVWVTGPDGRQFIQKPELLGYIKE